MSDSIVEIQLSMKIFSWWKTRNSEVPFWDSNPVGTLSINRLKNRRLDYHSVLWQVENIFNKLAVANDNPDRATKLHFMSCAFPPDIKPPNLITALFSLLQYCTVAGIFYATHYTVKFPRISTFLQPPFFYHNYVLEVMRSRCIISKSFNSFECSWRSIFNWMNEWALCRRIRITMNVTRI